MMNDIIVLFPTPREAHGFAHSGVEVQISGVGVLRTARYVQKLLDRHRPRWLILAGIAGLYAHAPLNKGEVVLVAREFEADLGAFLAHGFTPLRDWTVGMDIAPVEPLHCPYLPVDLPWPQVASLSVNAAMAPFIDTRNAEIENMEGAAFFQVCLSEQQAFLELRALSNLATPEDTDWDMDQAIDALHLALHRLLSHLDAPPDHRSTR